MSEETLEINFELLDDDRLSYSFRTGEFVVLRDAKIVHRIKVPERLKKTLYQEADSANRDYIDRVLDS